MPIDYSGDFGLSSDEINEKAKQDPNYNPRDHLIARDKNSWRSSISSAVKDLGVSDSDINDALGDVERQVSYAQNSGRDPGEFINSAISKLKGRYSNKPGGADNSQASIDFGQTGNGGGNNSNNSNSSGPDYSSMFSEQNAILRALQEQSIKRDAEIAAEKAAAGAKRDQLYTTLLDRSQQNLTIDPRDQPISGRVDAFRAEQDRNTRNAISDMAEQAGPYANLQGQRRMLSENAGINTGNLQAQLMTNELTARRAEISDALNGMRGILTNDQQFALQRELDSYDNQLAQIGQGFQAANQVGGLDLGFDNLALQRQVSLEDLMLRRLGIDRQNDQYYADLGLRTENQGSYWDAVRSGQLG